MVRRVFFWACFGSFLALGSARPGHLRSKISHRSSPTKLLTPNSTASSKQAALARYLSLPLYFEPAPAWGGKDGEYEARWGNYALQVSRQGVFWLFKGAAKVGATFSEESKSGRSGREAWRKGTFGIRFLSMSSRARLIAADVLPGESNYFLGSNPRAWRRNVPHYAALRLEDLYPGVNLVFYGRGSDLEFNIEIAPRANPHQIRLGIIGAGRTEKSVAGGLIFQVGTARIVLHKPVAYQQAGRGRRRVDSRYVVRDRALGIRLGAYDRNRPIVIDPVVTLTYSTFLGGSGTDSGNSVALDSSGAAYIAGNTTALDFPEGGATKIGPTGGPADLFIAKVDTTKSGAASLVYLTFIGGTGDDEGGLVAVDSAGNAALLGSTTSPDFPTQNPIQSSLNGPSDITVSKLNASGNQLLFSTYFGGLSSEATQRTGGIAVDSSGNIFVASDTNSTNLKTTPGAFQSAYGGGTSDGFMAEFSPAGTLLYSTYLGINATVGLSGIAVDTAGKVYLAGFTSQPSGNSFPTTNGFQAMYGGGPFDAFAMKLNPAGSGAGDLIYSTFLGGDSADQAFAIGVDSANPPNAYVVGSTQSDNFPVNGTNLPWQTKLNGNTNAFLSVIRQSSSGATQLNYSTYLGGSVSDQAFGVAVAAPNQVYVAGEATSADFPILCSLQSLSGTSDAFLAEIDPTMPGASSLIFGSFLGGSADSQANALAVDSSGDAFLSGKTSSSDLPVNGSAKIAGFQPLCSSCSASSPLPDAFLAEITAGSGAASCAGFSMPILNFGNEPLGSASAPETVALTNNGDAPLNISGVTVAGVNASDFSETDDCLMLSPLSPGKKCDISATFTPSTVALESAEVSVSDDGVGSPQALKLVGTGTAPVASLTPSNLNFGSQPQGTFSNSQTVTLANTGNATLTISNISLSGSNPTDFTFAENTCAVNLTVAPGSNCTLSIQFAPQATGSFTAQVGVTDNADNQAGSVQSTVLSGTGTPPAPVVSFTPMALNFGSEAIGSMSGSQTVTLTNTGSATLDITSIAITGTNQSEFSVVASGTTCPTANGTLAVNMSCTIAADFTPQSTGSKTAEITLTDNASGSPQAIALSGTGVAPSATLSPGSLTFGSQSIGTPSPPQNITLSNMSSTALTISAISIAGTNSSDFNETNNCPPVLNGGGSCVIGVTFKPTAPGNRSANLTVSDNAAGSPQTAPLTGTATAPIVSLSPSSLSFSGQLAGSASAASPVSAMNGGNGVLVISSVNFSGANPGDFSESDTCSGGVNPGANCTLSVVFKPLAAGARAAIMSINDNALDSPQQIPLSGTATDFSLAAVGSGSISATVTAGQTAMYNLQLVPSNGFVGNVSLACSGMPAGATCAANPPALDVTSAAPAPFAVSVTTTTRAAATPWNRPRPTQRVPVSPIPFGVLLTGLVLLFAARRKLRLSWQTVAPGLALAMLLLLSACGGGAGGAAPGTTGTPAGTYTLTVTGSQQGVNRTVSLTLIVQ